MTVSNFVSGQDDGDMVRISGNQPSLLFQSRTIEFAAFFQTEVSEPTYIPAETYLINLKPKSVKVSQTYIFYQQG